MERMFLVARGFAMSASAALCRLRLSRAISKEDARQLFDILAGDDEIPSEFSDIIEAVFLIQANAPTLSVH